MIIKKDKKRNKQIAAFSVLYLKNRMMINQKLISLNENQVDFEEFTVIYNNFVRFIEYAEEHQDEMNEVASKDKQISFIESVVSLKNRFVRNYADSVVLSEQEIDELMGYIKESIEKYGLNHSGDYYNETFFIREVLKQLADKMDEARDEKSIEKLERVKKFLSYARANKNIGFCETIEGHISFIDDDFRISTHNLKNVCIINKTGINEATSNELVDEDLLLADKLYVGSLTSDESQIYIFLEKVVNGQIKMKAISYNQEIYDISNEKNKTGKVATFEKAVIYGKINDIFEEIGFGFLASNIYTKDTFRETIDAYNRYNNMSPEERKEIENVIEAATSWWISKMSTHTFDSGIEGKIGENLLGTTISYCSPVSRVDTVSKFKTILGNKIRILLLSRPIVGLHVDYQPEGELALAIKESKISASFPLRTFMSITENKVEVKQGDLAEYEIIYSSDMHNSLKQ